jgi:TPP-dependent pyruvate/acetoin dehydrogenase alpha subunit
MVWTPEALLAFEEEVAQEFAAGKIRAPVHLSGGNEQQLIEIFEKIKADDWVLCGWRAHYHCLLKGVPPDELKQAIRTGHSVSLCFPRHKILSSGIVGGTAPIAVGIAWAIKRRNNEAFGPESYVYCFLGDMTFEAGIVQEAMKYAARRSLPVRWIVEDNGKSVCTDTKLSWGLDYDAPSVKRYNYELSRPHVGIGKWVRF